MMKNYCFEREHTSFGYIKKMSPNLSHVCVVLESKLNMTIKRSF